MKLFKYSLIALISISLFSCKKDDDSNNNSDGYLSIMINGQQESFSMSDSDWNTINDGTCFSSSNPTTVDNVDIGNFENGSFTLWVGDEPVTNMTYKCKQNATDYCGTPRAVIYVGGDLEDRLEDLHIEPIFRLEPKGDYDCTISGLTSNTISINWQGELQVMGFNSDVLGTYKATFIANNVAIDDVR